MRDKLIHFYFGVQLELVWAVSTCDIPTLERDITRILIKEGWDKA